MIRQCLRQVGIVREVHQVIWGMASARSGLRETYTYIALYVCKNKKVYSYYIYKSMYICIYHLSLSLPITISESSTKAEGEQVAQLNQPLAGQPLA